MSGSFGSSGKASRLGQSALKRGGAAVGSSLSSAKSTKRVQLAAPEKEDELQATEIALDIQEGVSGSTHVHLDMIAHAFCCGFDCCPPFTRSHADDNPGMLT